MKLLHSPTGISKKFAQDSRRKFFYCWEVFHVYKSCLLEGDSKMFKSWSEAPASIVLRWKSMISKAIWIILIADWFFDWFFLICSTREVSRLEQQVRLPWAICWSENILPPTRAVLHICASCWLAHDLSVDDQPCRLKPSPGILFFDMLNRRSVCSWMFS